MKNEIKYELITSKTIFRASTKYKLAMTKKKLLKVKHKTLIQTVCFLTNETFDIKRKVPKLFSNKYQQANNISYGFM